MNTPLDQKSSVDEIRIRFDGDVERFSNLDTGQKAIIDAPISMELIAQGAFGSTTNINKVLDIGCGAGNNILKLSQYVSAFDCDLVDLSLPMLEKARERIFSVNTGEVRIFQGDFRKIKLDYRYDVIFATAVLHHLRDNQDWESVFSKIYRLTAPGGSLWITDLVSHEIEAVHALIWKQYGEYLYSLGGEKYKNRVFEYIDKEDSPRSVTYQLNLLKKVGYRRIDLLHKNSCFAAFGAIKAGY